MPTSPDPITPVPETTLGADCHFHLFCRDQTAYPFSPEARYTPRKEQMGTAQQLLALLDFHGLSHGLVVSSGPYQDDCRCALDSIAGSSGRLKGIAIVKPGISDIELARLDAAGIVGIRLNMLRDGMAPFTGAESLRLLARCRELGWFVQIHCEHEHLIEAGPVVRAEGVRLLIDHFSRPRVEEGIHGAGFAALLELSRSTDCVVKLSGPFRSSRAGYPYEDVDAFVAAVIEAYGLDRCIWGSDWPFMELDERADYSTTLTCLHRWIPDASDRRRVLWDTPKRLFNFTSTHLPSPL